MFPLQMVLYLFQPKTIKQTNNLKLTLTTSPEGNVTGKNTSLGSSGASLQ